MFCMNCGQDIPDIAQWCPTCGTAVAKAGAASSGGGSAGAGAAAAVAPALSVSRHIGDEVKARSRDAWAGIKLFAKSPVGGLPESYAMFDTSRAMKVGVAFAVIYELTTFIGLYLLGSRLASTFGLNLRAGDASFSDVIKILLIGFVPFVSLTGAVALARKVFRGTGVFAGDVYTAGAALLPLGLAVLATAILGLANFEIILVLFVFALSYNILMLYSGSSRIAEIPEAGAAPAVPVMLLVSAWLTKIIVAALV